MKTRLMVTVAAVALLACAGPSYADMAAAERWIDEEFQPSTLTREEQLQEMQWFIDAAAPFAGILTRRFVDEGAFVSNGAQVFEITDFIFNLTAAVIVTGLLIVSSALLWFVLPFRYREGED